MTNPMLEHLNCKFCFDTGVLNRHAHNQQPCFHCELGRPPTEVDRLVTTILTDEEVPGALDAAYSDGDPDALAANVQLLARVLAMVITAHREEQPFDRCIYCARLLPGADAAPCCSLNALCGKRRDSGNPNRHWSHMVQGDEVANVPWNPAEWKPAEVED